MIVATITSGQPVPVPNTPLAARSTTRSPTASLREQIHTEGMFASPVPSRHQCRLPHPRGPYAQFAFCINREMWMGRHCLIKGFSLGASCGEYSGYANPPLPNPTPVSETVYPRVTWLNSNVSRPIAAAIPTNAGPPILKRTTATNPAVAVSAVFQSPIVCPPSMIVAARIAPTAAA